MPGIGGLESARTIQPRGDPLPAIVMSAYGDVPMVVRAMKAGALNFLEKPCRDQQLWEAIQEALQWDGAHRQQMALRSKVLHRLERLTPGEHDVLRLLIDGKSNKAIAAELKLSVRTIEVRRAKLMKKMKAESLAELIRLTLAANPDYGKPQTAADNLTKPAQQPFAFGIKEVPMVLLDFSLFPLDKGESLSPYVARSLDIIDRSGLDYRCHAMGTTLEGDFDAALRVVKQCFEAWPPTAIGSSVRSRSTIARAAPAGSTAKWPASSRSSAAR